MTGASAWADDLRGRYDELLREYRTGLRAQLEGLSEEQARRRLVPSRTTLLGLLEHVTCAEAHWFDHATTGTPPAGAGVVGHSSSRHGRRDGVDLVTSAGRAERSWAAGVARAAASCGPVGARLVLQEGHARALVLRPAAPRQDR